MDAGSLLMECSSELLTEDGVFVVGAGTAHAVSKTCGNLTLVDAMSLAVINQLGTYPEAKIIKFSPNSEYISFIDKSNPISIRIIEIETNTVFNVALDNQFTIEHIFWSSDSRFIAFTSELGIYIGVYNIGEKTKYILEGLSLDDFDRPLCSFSSNIEYLSVIRYTFLTSYCTESWEIHSNIKCPVDPVGMIYTDCYTVALWTSSGRFVVFSLTGETIFSIHNSITSRIKTAKLCHEKRILALATYDEKVELYDVLSWKKLYTFEYPLNIKNSKSKTIWTESSSILDFIGPKYTAKLFTKASKIACKPIQNICDEFKIKSSRRYYLTFSNGNKYIASYSPGIEKVIWIHILKYGCLAGIVSVNEGFVKGLKWHPEKQILAVITLDSIVFWSQEKTFAVYSQALISSFHWLKSKLSMCSISTDKEGVFICLKSN